MSLQKYSSLNLLAIITSLLVNNQFRLKKFRIYINLFNYIIKKQKMGYLVYMTIGLISQEINIKINYLGNIELEIILESGND